MNYLNTMGSLLSFSRTFSLKTEKDIEQLQLYCIVNVLVLGLIYGGSAALFTNIILSAKGMAAGSADIAKVMIAGIPVAFFMHAGAALFIWVFLDQRMLLLKAIICIFPTLYTLIKFM